MVAGMPAAYKSMFTLNLVHEMKVSCLYISADSDAAVQISRLAAMVTHDMSRGIREALEGAGADYYADQLSESMVQFSFDSNPDMFDIEDEISAWVELYDEYPEVIVVDNLRNVFSGADNEHGGYKAIQQRLIDISRETGACVITMHHMLEGNGRKSTEPAPRNAIDGKIAQLPDFIFSVARDGDAFYMSVVKDRNNQDYPEADRVHMLRVDRPIASFYAYDAVEVRAAQIEAAAENWTPTTVLERTS